MCDRHTICLVTFQFQHSDVNVVTQYMYIVGFILYERISLRASYIYLVLSQELRLLC